MITLRVCTDRFDDGFVRRILEINSGRVGAMFIFGYRRRFTDKRRLRCPRAHTAREGAERYSTNDGVTCARLRRIYDRDESSAENPGLKRRTKIDRSCFARGETRSGTERFSCSRNCKINYNTAPIHLFLIAGTISFASLFYYIQFYYSASVRQFQVLSRQA